MKRLFYFPGLALTYLSLLLLGSVPVTGQVNTTNSSKTKSASFINLRGKVIDEKDAPMIGVSVQVKNSGIGLTTDIEGRLDINAPNGKSTLVISYLGYVTQELSLTNTTDYTIKMVPAINALNDVVVVGYNTLRLYFDS
jgi:hypothetical protein